jgi:nicotinamidase-related amidase
MTLDRLANPALVVVDMQNDFVRVGAPLEVPASRDTIGANRDLIALCRRRKIPVVFTRFIAGPQPTLIWQWSPMLAPPTCCCWPGHRRFYPDVDRELDCAAVIDELAPEPGEAIVDKYGYGAFHNTLLDDVLRARHVESVIVTGTVTQVCVEETAREAFHRGYRTTMVSDAVSSWLPDLHEATLKNFAMKFGWVSTTKDVIQELEARPPR